MNRQFSKDEIQMVNEDIFKNKQTNKTVQPHWHQRNANQNFSELAPHLSQGGSIKKASSNKCWRGCGQRSLGHCWGDVNWSTQDGVLSKKPENTPISYDPAVLTQGIYSKKLKSTSSPRELYINVYYSTIHKR
jgi:hypothetical protein